MRSDDRTERVRDLLGAGVLWVEDGNHGENRPLQDEFSSEGTHFVRPDDLSHGRVDFANCDRITSGALQRIRKGRGRPGDIAFTHRATVGRIARVGVDAPDFVANPGVTLWRVLDKTTLDPNYLYYFMQTPFFMNQVWAEAGNTDTFPYISLTQQRGLVLRFPVISEQCAIGEALATLDDRIALLRETNATLEAIAQALFKSWFVDFDPVRAKSQGLAPAGMDEATAALFPDGFEESALGPIPRGWGVRSLDQIASYLNGLALQKYPPADDAWLPVIKIAQLRKGDTVGADRAGRNIKPEYIVRNGDVLFSWSGSLEVEVWCGGEGALNQHLFKVTSKEFPKWFYFCWTRHHLNRFRQIAASKATTMGHIQRGHLSEAKVLVPPPELLDVMSASAAPLLDRITQNELQAQTLAEVRDTLLPRLISGQLRLPEAAAEVAEA